MPADSAPAETGALEDRLRGLIDSGRLRGTPAAQARDLLAGLERPARLVLAGPAIDTARAVGNALGGAMLLPEGLALPDLVLRHGPALTAQLTRADGTTSLWQGHPLDEIDAPAAGMVTLEAPLPALERLTLVLPGFPATAGARQAALAWAAARCDITLWCSAGFGPDEAALWAGAGPALQANAHLCAAGAGPLPRGFLGRLDAADPEAVARAVGAMVREGLAARRDHALLFLARYEPAAAARRRPADDPARRPEDTSRGQQPAGAAATPPEMQAPGTAAAPPPGTGPATVAAAAGFARDAATDLAPDLAATLADAPITGPQAGVAAALRACGRELLRDLPMEPHTAGDSVLTRCLSTLEELAAAEPAPPDLILDGLDAMYLLRGEGGLPAALEALNLLLQLRRELDTEIAA